MNKEVRYPAGFVQGEQQEDSAPIGTTLAAAARTVHEDNLLDRIRQAGLPDPEREYRFAAPVRAYRADFAFVRGRVLVEVEGGVWSGGRHTRGAGYREDIIKYNLAVLLDWVVLRFTPDMIYDGSAIGIIKEVLDARGMGRD